MALHEAADKAYERFRRVVIDASPDGRAPEPDAMTSDQRAAAADLEAAEQALADYRAVRHAAFLEGGAGGRVDAGSQGRSRQQRFG